MTREKRILPWVGATALTCVGIFGFLAWRNVTVEPAAPDDAVRQFAEIRDRFGSAEPLLQIDAHGGVTRRKAPEASETIRATRLHVLAYRMPQQRLVRADAPFWFLKMKGAAAQYTLRDTGLDLDRLGVSPADLERYGACLILDEMRKNGDRLLVWTE